LKRVLGYFPGEGAQSRPGGWEIMPYRLRDVCCCPQHPEICPSRGCRETSERTPWRYANKTFL